MTIKQFIEKAIEGGWKENCFYTQYVERASYIPSIFLDPAAWRAVGKVQGWDYKGSGVCGYMLWSEEMQIPIWHGNWHGLIDALAYGKTIEQYLATL